MFILNIAFCWNNETEMTLKQETHGISTHQSFLEDCKFITVYEDLLLFITVYEEIDTVSYVESFLWVIPGFLRSTSHFWIDFPD